MTEQNKKDIEIAIGYLKLFAAMNGMTIKGPKTRFWSSKYYFVTARGTDMTEEQKTLLLENIHRLEKMIGES